MFQRVTRGQTATLRFPLPESPESASVTITRSDGTVLVDAQPATPEDYGASYELAAADTASLDLLRCSLALSAASGDSEAEGWVEIVGGRLFDLADLRRLDPLEDEAEYPDDVLDDVRTSVEVALEDACGRVAFFPRHARVKLDGSGTEDQLLPHVDPRVLLAVEIDGTSLAPSDLALLEVEECGSVYREDRWPRGRFNVVMEYEYGFRFPPGRVPHAGMRLARHLLLDSPVDDRAVSVTDENGMSQVFTTAGVRGAVFSVPEANAVVDAYRVAGAF